MEPTVTEIYETVRQLRSARGTNQVSREQAWIIAHLTDSRLKALIPNLSIVALHSLSALVGGEKTGIELAESLEVTRGGVTRAARKLKELGLIAAAKHADDQKKIYYRLLPDGATIAAQHDRMHRALERDLVTQLQARYTPAELKVVARFLHDLAHAEKTFH